MNLISSQNALNAIAFTLYLGIPIIIILLIRIIILLKKQKV